MADVKKLSLAGILITAGVVCSPFYIPMGTAKCFPVQHLINVLAGVLLGPFYSVGMAFCTSFIRVMTGTGSLLAFPGSMIGAFLCGILFKYTKKMQLAFLGEVFGTGILGAFMASAMAGLFLSNKAALFGFVIPFGLSSLAGAAISLVFIRILKRTGILKHLNLEAKNHAI